LNVDELKELGRGTYTLVINLSENVKLKVGKLGLLDFPKGFYSYTGSALGPSDYALYFRVKRHLSKHKKVKWHIDYFLLNPVAKVIAVIAAPSNSRMECNVSYLLSSCDDIITFYKFGATDCKSNKCIGHLHFYLLKDFNRILLLIKNIYHSLSLNHKILFLEKDDC